MKFSKFIILSLAALSLTGCAIQKRITDSSTNPIVEKSEVADNSEKARIDFLDMVNSNASYQKNITAGITFRITQDNGKEISVPGQLRMRKDQIIRLSLQVPILGSEVGRMEFSKDYVVIIDRMHKQYIKASYKQVGFLRDNGIDFYTLQALFWNKLLLPGKSTVGYTDLDKFSTDVTTGVQQIPIKLKDGKLTYTWTAERKNGVIESTEVDYQGSGNSNSSLIWLYSKFNTFGSKPFPYDNTLTVMTTVNGKYKMIKASYEINNISTSDDWDATITIPTKYKEVSAEEILGKLTKN